MTMTTPERIKVLWSLPTHGDSRYLDAAEGDCAVNLSYLRQIAQAADSLGYYGVHLPTGRSCEDSWVVAAALASQTEKLRFLVAVRPGLQSPSLAARMTATLDRLSGGRLLVNVVPGGYLVENAGDGIHLNHDERYEVTREFLDIYKALLAGETVNYEGKHFRIVDSRLLFGPMQENGPKLCFGGSSDAANTVAARQVDKYLIWGGPPAQIHSKIEIIRRLTEAEGRDVSFGIRLHVIVCDTNDEAWAEANHLISRLDDVAKAQATFARMGFVGQRRMAELREGNRDKLKISPNLWAGVGLVRGGAGAALIGDAPTVAERIDEYRRIGIDTFILSGYPHLDEAFRFGERVLPLLPLDEVAANMGPFGKAVGNDYRPAAKHRPVLVTGG